MNDFGYPESWANCKLKDICGGQHGYAFPSESFNKKGKYAVVKMANVVGGGQLEFRKDQSRVDVNIEEYKSYLVSNGDILMALTDLSSTGNFLGTVAMFTFDEIALLNQRLLRIDLRTECINKTFLFYFLMSPQFREYMKTPVAGAIQKNIGKDFVLDCSFPVPPLSEQVRIVKKIELLLKRLINIEDVLVHISGSSGKETPDFARLTLLKKSILKSAFFGKLVCPIASEGTGHELLEKIKSEQPLADEKKTAKKTSSPAKNKRVKK